MASLEKYIEQADDLLDQVFKPWGAIRDDDSAVFKTLVDKACLYRLAMRAAAKHARTLTEEEKFDLAMARREFAEAYKTFWEKQRV